MIFWWSNHCWESTLPKVMGKIQKKTYPRFHRFCYKHLLKIDFFKLVFLIIVCYFHILFSDSNNIFMISNWNSEHKFENSSKSSVFIQNFSSHRRRLFTFHVITWLIFDLEQIPFQRYPSISIPKTNMKIAAVWWDIGKDIRGEGQNDLLGCLRW